MSRTPITRSAAALGSAAALLVLGVACASDGGETVGAAVDSAVPRGDGTAPAVTLTCGDRTHGLLARTSGLAVTGDFPPRVDRGGDGTFVGTVTVTGTGSRVSGVTSPEADVFVARAGEVVSTPVAKDLIGQPFDLGSDASKAFTARGSIRPCAAGAGELLPAGHYDVFAVVVVNRDDGPAVVAAGGPWPIEVT